jgi:hypothetical protein
MPVAENILEEPEAHETFWSHGLNKCKQQPLVPLGMHPVFWVAVAKWQSRGTDVGTSHSMAVFDQAFSSPVELSSVLLDR